MPIAPDDLDQITLEFQYFTRFSSRYHDLFDDMCERLGMLKHPEQITAAQIQELRNLTLEHKAQADDYRDGIQRCMAALLLMRAQARSEGPPQSSVVTNEAEALIGCLATVAAGMLTIGVVLGMWIAG